MKVNESSAEFARSEQLQASRTGTETGAREPSGSSSAGGRSDRVAISDAGRALAIEDEGRPALPPERIAEIRQRILEGAYESLDAVEEVARRVLASGDL